MSREPRGLKVVPDLRTASSLPDEGDQPPPRANNKRAAMTLTLVLLLGLLILGGYAVTLWRTATMADKRAATTEEQLARLWRQVQDLERENQGLKQSTEGRIASLKEEIQELKGPKLNWPVYDASPRRLLRLSGNSKQENEIQLPQEAGGFSLILNSETQARFPDYRVEIVTPDGKILWQADGLHRNQLGAFNISLTSNFLAEGHYNLKVYGKSGARLKLLEAYPIVLTMVPRSEP